MNAAQGAGGNPASDGAPSRIFIGGTGRSGTTILYQVLGCHRDIHAFPWEMRFLVEHGGLLNLVDALSIRYSPAQATEALFEFEVLMKDYLANPRMKPYIDVDLPNWIGQEYYWSRLDQFCRELVEVRFPGSTREVVHPLDEGRLVDFARRLRNLLRRVRGRASVPIRLLPTRAELSVVKYFPDRSQLMQLAAAFVDDLFLHAARNHHKKTWCEKTPHNQLHLDFLWELFPDSSVVIIKRDPRGVVRSLMSQSWAPNDVEGACAFVRVMYDRWFEMRRITDFSRHKYHELKLEELVENPGRHLAEIAAFCGLEDRYENLPDLVPDKVNYWRDTMSADEIRRANAVLGSHIERMGYEV